MYKSDMFNQSLLNFKQQLARKLMAGFAIFFTIALPISLYRWFEIGFQFVFILHILLTLITYASFFRANKANYKVDIIIMIGLLSSMIISGTLSFGLQTGAVTFVVFCCFLIVITWGFLFALLYALIWCLFLITVGYLFANSYLQYTLNPSAYADTTGAWVVVALGSSLSIIFMLIAAKQSFNYFSSLVEEIEQQKIEIEQLANTDTLTGFSAARLAMPMLSQTINMAQRDNSKVAVLFVDLNKFKDINDTFGHDAGDQVLQESATRMRSVLREMDISLRIGGDEFLFIIPNAKDKQDVSLVLQRLIDTWSSPIRFENAQITITGSIGVAMCPDDATTAKELRQKADAAMYYAKSNGIAIKFYS